MPDRLLYPVFQRLRERGASLGVAEYMAGVSAVRGGLHVESPERLGRLLALLWAKSREERLIVAEVFEAEVAPLLRPPEPEPKADSETKAEAAAGAGKSPETVDADLGQIAARREAGAAEGGSAMPRPRGWLGEGGRKFRLTPRPPVKRRDAARAFQRLRRPLCEGPGAAVDVAATVDRVARQGFLDKPVRERLRKNRVELLVFVDRGGSMTPLETAISPLFAALRTDSGLKPPVWFHFHDCPREFVYRKPGLIDPVPLETALRRPPAGVCALVVSDGGAARGDFDGRRLEETAAFLDRLGKLTPRMVWVNPMPQARWATSTAGKIGERVSMVPLDRFGLERAARVLRGDSR